MTGKNGNSGLVSSLLELVQIEMTITIAKALQEERRKGLSSLVASLEVVVWFF